MATNSESLTAFAYEALDLIRGTISNTEDIDLREVKNWINNQRALWLRNELNKNRVIDDGIIQDLGCVAVEDGDPSECCTSGTCTLKKSVLEIPQTIERHGVNTIVDIGPVNKALRRYNKTNYEGALKLGFGRFNRNEIYAFILNKHLHVKSDPDNVMVNMLRYVNLRGVFEDPTQVAAFKTCSGSPCYTDDTVRYPINKWIKEYIISAIVQGKFAVTAFAQSDVSNNSAFNINAAQQQRSRQQQNKEDEQ